MYNLSKTAKQDSDPKTHEKYLEDNRDEHGLEAEPNPGNLDWMLQQNHKDKDNSVPFQGQLSEARSGAPSKVTEKKLDEDTGWNLKRTSKAWDQQVKAPDLMAEAYDQERRKAYLAANKSDDRDTAFWDDFVRDQMLGPNTTIVSNVQPSQLQNDPERFKNLQTTMPIEMCQRDNRKRMEKDDKLVDMKSASTKEAQVPVDRLLLSIDTELNTGLEAAWRDLDHMTSYAGGVAADLKRQIEEAAWGFFNAKEKYPQGLDAATQSLMGLNQRASQFIAKNKPQSYTPGDEPGQMDHPIDEVYSSGVGAIKDADAMLFHLHATAAKHGRELTENEQQMVVDISSGRLRALAALIAPEQEVDTPSPFDLFNTQTEEVETTSTMTAAEADTRNAQLKGIMEPRVWIKQDGLLSPGMEAAAKAILRITKEAQWGGGSDLYYPESEEDAQEYVRTMTGHDGPVDSQSMAEDYYRVDYDDEFGVWFVYGGDDDEPVGAGSPDWEFSTEEAAQSAKGGLVEHYVSQIEGDQSDRMAPDAHLDMLYEDSVSGTSDETLEI
jgi:hypothetical protein